MPSVHSRAPSEVREQRTPKPACKSGVWPWTCGDSHRRWIIGMGQGAEGEEGLYLPPSLTQAGPHLRVPGPLPAPGGGEGRGGKGRGPGSCRAVLVNIFITLPFSTPGAPSSPAPPSPAAPFLWPAQRAHCPGCDLNEGSARPVPSIVRGAGKKPGAGRRTPSRQRQMPKLAARLCARASGQGLALFAWARGCGAAGCSHVRPC